jgi:hypothetical protein
VSTTEPSIVPFTTWAETREGKIPWHNSAPRKKKTEYTTKLRVFMAFLQEYFAFLP